MNARTGLIPAIAMCFAIGVAASPAPALAQEQARGAEAIDRGIAAYEEADLQGAREWFERAAEGPLDRADVLRLLANRSLVYFALGEFGPLERDLLALASLEPDFSLGMRAPPPMQSAYERVKTEVEGTLSLTVRLEAMEAGVRLRAETAGDRAGVVDRVVLSARGMGGSWQRAEGGTLVLPVLSGRDVELHAEAIGPGGAVIAFDGTESAPRTERVPPLARREDTASGMSRGAKVGLSVGVLAVVAAIAVVAVLLAGSADQGTRPVGPFVE